MGPRAIILTGTVLILAACAQTRTLAQIGPQLDSLRARYLGCIEERARHYVRTVDDTRQVIKITSDICRNKLKPIKSQLWEADIKPDIVAEYMRALGLSAVETVLRVKQENRRRQQQSAWVAPTRVGANAGSGKKPGVAAPR